MNNLRRNVKHIVNTNSLERQKREKTEREKVRVLENLKGQAVTLQETAASYLFFHFYLRRRNR